jgi:dUTP pyrophosphatase
MKLKIKPESIQARNLYENHTTFYPGDSGLDLFNIHQKHITSGETVFIDLEIKCEMVDDSGNNVSYYLYPRSSISKTPLRLANNVGIIDAGYRGNLKIALDNIKLEDYQIQSSERLVQICAPNLQPFEIEVVDELSDSKRGENGFGSTNNLTEHEQSTENVEQQESDSNEEETEEPDSVEPEQQESDSNEPETEEPEPEETESEEPDSNEPETEEPEPEETESEEPDSVEPEPEEPEPEETESEETESEESSSDEGETEVYVEYA